MNLNKKYLLFPKPRLNHLLFLFFFISSAIKQYILKDIKDKDNLSIPIFKLYVYNIGDFISLIPYLIVKKKTKSKNIPKFGNNQENNESTNYIYTDIENEQIDDKKKKSKVTIFIITLVDFIAQISTVTYYLIEGNQRMQVKHGYLTFVLVFNVIFLFLLSKFLLNFEFYLHHFFSFVIIVICLIVVTIIDFIEIKKESKDFINSVLYLAIRLFVALMYSLEDVLAKIVFLKYYISPYLLLLSKAILHFFYLIIFSIPLCFVKFKDEEGEYKIIFSMFGNIFDNKLYILFFLIYLINSFFYNILIFFIIDKFFPTHTAIAQVFENFGILLINIFTGGFKTNIAIRIIMYILLIFASFIFNEFLVINLCGLANNTKLFLDYKEKNDLSLINENNDNYTNNDNLTDVIIEENNQRSTLNNGIDSNIELTEL